jgi:hypothetical protein
MKKITLLFIFLPIISFAQWTQVGDDIDGEFANDNSGRRTAISDDGTIVAIGASSNSNATGHVRIFENTSGVWTQIGDDIDGEGEAFRTGTSLSMNNNGTIIATGATLFGTTEVPSRGYVQIFENISGNWTQVGDDLLGLNTNDQAGEAVSLNGDGSIVAMSAIYNTTGGPSFSGYVQVFENIGGVWSQIGATIYGEGSGDLSGSSIHLNDVGNILAIGAPANNGDNEQNSGHVRIYQNIGGNWTQVGADIEGEGFMDDFGISVSLNNIGTILAVGGHFNSGVTGTFSGHVRVFENIEDTWVQIGDDIDGEAVQDFSGLSVSLNGQGNILAVGAPQNDADGNGINHGHARIFEYDNDNWIQIGEDIDGESASDGSGTSVSLSNNGSTIAIGAIYNDDNGNNSGHVRVYNNQLLSTNDIDFAQHIKMYPNPSYGDTSIKLDKVYDDLNLNIYDTLGKQVFTDNYSQTDKIIINTDELAKGLYLLNVSSGYKKVSLKLVVN